MPTQDNIILDVEAGLEVETQLAGPQGLSAYEVYVKDGGELTEQEWLASLKGEKGDPGETGSPGIPGQPGRDGVDGFSPSANVSKSGSVATITITDKNGTTTAQVSDGTTPDLTDYVKNTDYATSGKGGVVKVGNNFIVNENGFARADISTYSQYQNLGDYSFIGKRTLENVITGKGLISDTDYATSSKGGVIKAGINGFAVTSAGNPNASTIDYTDYTSAQNYIFISKGTLENAITGKGLISDTDYATDNKGGTVKISGTYGIGVIANNGRIFADTKTYEQYNSLTTYGFISKGTLENVITGKDLATNPIVTTSLTSTYTIASLEGNNTYKLGEITSLTITAVATFDKESNIYFASGTTPTDISIPDTLTNLGDVPTLTTSDGVSTGTCDASKNYIISVLNNIAIWKKY